MPRFYVDIALADCGYGAVGSKHAVIDAPDIKNIRERFNALTAFPDSCPIVACPVPNNLLGLSDELVLAHYDQLHEALGDNRFYDEVMKVRNPLNGPRLLSRLKDRLVYSLQDFFSNKYL